MYERAVRMMLRCCGCGLILEILKGISLSQDMVHRRQELRVEKRCLANVLSSKF